MTIRQRYPSMDSSVAHPALYRAPMRSVDSDRDGVQRALSHGVCGMGGVLPSPPGSLEDALVAVAGAHTPRLAARIGRFAGAPDRSLVWTRDTDGNYWLGELAGPWRYDDSADAVAVDLVHVRPCRWLAEPVPDAHVPAAVLATFARGGKNWQQTHSDAALAASARLWKADRD